MTADLMAVMLEDALKIMSHECDARGEKPLYTKQDLDGVLELVKPSNYNQRVTLSDSIDVYLRDSAHILGSSLIEMHIGDDIVVFTGDLGNVPAPLLKTIYPVEYCDYLCMESVYGDRIHESHQEKERILERALEDTYSKKGVLIIPVFALERTQALLSALDELIEHNRVPRMPVFLDSPLAINATKVYRKYQSLFNEDTQQLLRGGNDLFSFPGLKLTASREESIAINEVPRPRSFLPAIPTGTARASRIIFLRALPRPKQHRPFCRLRARIKSPAGCSATAQSRSASATWLFRFERRLLRSLATRARRPKPAQGVREQDQQAYPTNLLSLWANNKARKCLHKYSETSSGSRSRS